MEYIRFANFILSIQYGYTAENTTKKGKYKYLRITDIVPYFIDKDTVPFCEITDDKAKKYLVYKDDLLIARTGATTGYNTIIDDSFKNFVFASYLIRFNYDKKILNPQFVKHVLKSKQWKNFISSYIGGSAQPGMNPRTFGKFRFPFFSYKEQYKIAFILSSYDNLIENNNRRIKILEQMAENLYKEWFVRFRFPEHEKCEFENGIPKQWEIKKVGQCVKRFSFGKLYKDNELENSGKVIVIDQSINEFVGYHNNEPSHYANKENPIILFGDHTCKFKLMLRNFSLCENVIPFIASDNEKIDTIFLYFATKNLIKTSEYKRHWTTFVNMKILEPSISIQHQFSNTIMPLLNKVDLLFQVNQNLIKQRDLLLPRLMSGKLQVK